MSLKIGDAGYRIIGPIASGGMGEVYKAEHIITKRVEAIKLLSGAGTAEESERFLREIQLQASLTHPNIAAVYNAFRVNDDLVMVMELVEGEPLRALLEHGSLPLPVAINYASQVLKAMAYAHAHGVIHRDVSPSNIVVTPQGTIKLMDFGLAKAAASPSASQSGAYLGSPHYMSPEQVKDASRASARSDIYSFGAVLYEMVTGRKVFAGDSSFTVMQAQVEAVPVPPIQIDARIPPALNTAILTALEKDPERRFPSADSFRQAVEKASRGEAASPARPARTFRRALLVPVAGVAAACAVILPMAYYAASRPPRPAPKTAPAIIEIRRPVSATETPVTVEPRTPSPAIEEPPSRPAPRRPMKLARAPKRDLTPTVTGEELSSTTRRVSEPVRTSVVLSAPPPPPAPVTAPAWDPVPAPGEPIPQPETAAAGPPPPSEEVSESPAAPAKDKKPPNRFRRALGKIVGAFH